MFYYQPTKGSVVSSDSPHLLLGSSSSCWFIHPATLLAVTIGSLSQTEQETTTTMSLRMDQLAKSLLIVPQSYQEVAPHHVVVLYTAYQLLSSTALYRKACDKLLTVYSKLTDLCLPLVHAGLIPDFLIRYGMRIQLRDRLLECAGQNAEQELADKLAIVQDLHTMPIAIQTAAANQQHYEVPARFYDLCLGPCKKYSSGLWPTPSTTFEESELHMLELYCQRAGVQDGMKIVDLGCGWGSLTLHLAERYPNCQITGISNSHSQREYILQTAQKRGYNVQNITIVTVSKCKLGWCPKGWEET